MAMSSLTYNPGLAHLTSTQGSFQQSLVEIGSVVSEEKTFLKFHPPFFSNLHNRQKFKVQSS
jgi:UV DNA damage repair endonuclease